jgi:hypothetical protein
MGAPAPVFHAQVAEDGSRLVFIPAELPQRRAHLRLLKGLSVDVTITEHKETRSRQANAYYWGNVLEAIHEYTGHSKNEIHDAMCELFIPNEQRQLEFLNYLTGEVITVTVDTRRSSKLDTEPFYKFVENVRQWARESLGVETKDPDPEYWRRHE